MPASTGRCRRPPAMTAGSGWRLAPQSSAVCRRAESARSGGMSRSIACSAIGGSIAEGGAGASGGRARSLRRRELEGRVDGPGSGKAKDIKDNKDSRDTKNTAATEAFLVLDVLGVLDILRFGWRVSGQFSGRPAPLCARRGLVGKSHHGDVDG